MTIENTLPGLALDITGNVTDAVSGAPLSGVVVTVGTVHTTTNAQGHYLIYGFPASTHTITATLANYITGTQTLTLPTYGTVTVNLALYAAATLTGTVTDALSGSALSGATVTLGTQQTSTNAAGQYTIGSLPPGGATLSVSLSGYQTLTRGVTLSAGATLTVNCALASTAAQCHGQVTDAATGMPIANATVTLAGQHCVTNSQGSYTLTESGGRRADVHRHANGLLYRDAHRQPGGRDQSAAQFCVDRVRLP